MGAPVFVLQHWKLLRPERLMPLELLGMNRVKDVDFYISVSNPKLKVLTTPWHLSSVCLVIFPVHAETKIMGQNQNFGDKIKAFISNSPQAQSQHPTGHPGLDFIHNFMFSLPFLCHLGCSWLFSSSKVQNKCSLGTLQTHGQDLHWYAKQLPLTCISFLIIIC